MKRLLFLLAILFAFTTLGWGQYFADRAMGTNPLTGGLSAITRAQVRVCSLPASGSPCTPTATITDVFGNPLTVVGGNFGQLTADVIGRFNFGCTPGNYLIQIAAQSSNTPQNNYTITCPSTGAGFITGASINGGLVVTGTTLGLQPCSNTQSLQFITGTGWTCANTTFNVTSMTFPVAPGTLIQQTGFSFPGPGLYICLQSTNCTTASQLTKLDATLAGGTSSPSATYDKVGSGNIHNKSFLGANNLNNLNNLNVHKELTIPTYSNVTADPGTHFQPIESLVMFPNTNGPSDMIRADFYFLCTTCASNASTLQFRLSDPNTSCTLNSASFTTGANNQIWKATAYIVTNGTVNGSIASIDLIMDLAGGGTTLSGPQKTSTCAVNMGGGFTITLDLLVASSNAAVIDTWTPYMVVNTTSF